MKRNIIAVLMALTAIASGMAQSFEFRYGGTMIVDGGTVTIPAEDDSFFPDQKNCMTNMPTDPNNGLVLAVLDGTQKQANAALTILSNDLEPQMIQWCMGGLCELFMNTMAMNNTFTTESDGITRVEFDATDIRATGTLVAQLTVTIGLETKSVFIEFVNDAEEPDEEENPDDGETPDDTETPDDSTAIKATRQNSPASGAYYDLRGSRVTYPSEGIYIKDGRKVILK